MKLSLIAVFATLSSAAAFAPSTNGRSSVAMNAQAGDRKAFLAAAGASIFAAVPMVANAGTMLQEKVAIPTERWESGKPGAAARAGREERYKNARTQMTSSYPPIKSLTLERKSPVERLDINAPNFTAYKRTYPGLYKTP